MMWSYMIQLVFIIFVPISGRKGATANPDILIGLATAVRLEVSLVLWIRICERFFFFR